VIDGILFRERTGVPWRDLPARFGKVEDRLRTTQTLVGERHVGQDPAGRPSRPRRGRPHRLVHGERGFHLLSRPPNTPPERARNRRECREEDTRPDHLGGDKAYSSRRNRRYLRRRHIKHTIPEV
jgi:hypothetical protein